jgi:glycosyltransferase involved in cell wall biosynthesis
MRIWIIEVGEPLPPPIDRDTRKHRIGMLIDALIDAGHSVYWWASTFDHFHKRSRFTARKTFELNSSLTIRLLHGPGYSRNISFARLRHNRSIAIAFAEEARRAPKPDVILCCLPTPELAEESVVIAESLGVPVIIDVRDIWPEVYLTALLSSLRPAARPFLPRRYKKVGNVISKADGVTAVSETYLDWSLRLARRPRRPEDQVFPLGFPTDASKLPRPHQCEIENFRGTCRIPRGSLLFSFAGTFGNSYDLSTMVGAARILGRSGESGIHFVIAGDGDNRNYIRNLARDVGNLSFPGWLDRQDLQRLLLMSDVGVAPYVDSAKQSLPNKLYEYMATGLPILSSLVGESRKLLSEESIGLFYRPGDAAALAGSSRWIAARPELRQSMGLKSLELFNRRFSEDRIYKAMCDHITHLAVQPNGVPN